MSHEHSDIFNGNFLRLFDKTRTAQRYPCRDRPGVTNLGGVALTSASPAAFSVLQWPKTIITARHGRRANAQPLNELPPLPGDAASSWLLGLMRKHHERACMTPTSEGCPRPVTPMGLARSTCPRKTSFPAPRHRRQRPALARMPRKSLWHPGWGGAQLQRPCFLSTCP